MNTEQVPAEERCNCPSGSYHIKHTTQCYERRLTDLRASLIRTENGLKQAVKDAERYRWLRRQRRWYAASPPVPGIAFKFENFIADNGETLDAAIDAAMGKQS